MAITTLFSTVSLWLFLAVVVANLGLSYATTSQWTNQTTHQTRCIPTEREALLEFKKDLTDPSNLLATWDAAAAGDDDCCSWYGVSCHPHHLGDSTTQYVTGLHLRSLSLDEFYDGDIRNDWDRYKKTRLGGKVSSTLLSLNHLRYLDLSYNYFGGIDIPSFLGSMRSLRYLNLSNAGFGGMIPHQLGNLSNLQYLDLELPFFTSHYPTADVENLQWISGLSSLKFLDLSGWNLNNVLNWDEVILTTLPSLLQLHLSHCQLPSPQPHLLANNINASSISILDLSHNYIREQSTTSLSWVSGLKTLNSLNIEYNLFSGSFPRELQNMSSLREVYLGWNYFNTPIPNWLYGFHTTLKVLSLSSIGLSSFETQSSVKNFSSLSGLDLSYNNFQGLIPDEIQNMTSLQNLDLSSNRFRFSTLDWLDGFTRLEHLNLSENYLEGKISSVNWNMPSLVSIVMFPQFGNKLELEGGIPKSFKNSCNLRVLDLGGVKLRQDINQVLEILSLPGCLSNGLEELSLEDCQLFGNLSTTNQNFGRLMSLKKLDFGVNNLSGTLPIRLGRLKKLEELYLDGNSLVGDVSEAHFENLKDLWSFFASRNQLKLRVSPSWIPPFDQMLHLELGSWHIGPQFPTWLRSLQYLETLDLSSSSISTTIPVWFWNLSSNMEYLNLSHNQIHGLIPSTLSQFSFSMIDLSSNSFHGPLPLIHSNLIMLDLSNNSFSGSISKFLCSPNFNSSNVQANLQYLNLDQNLLYGEIPNCFSAWPILKVINLSNNKLNGTIPKSISPLGYLDSLHLRNNNLSGELSVSPGIISIDVGENELVGNISSFIEESSLSLKILILRSNKLSGQLPEKLCHAESMQVLDFANNLFDGTIPSCLGNLSAMVKMIETTGVIQVIDYPLMWESWENRFHVEHARFETALLGMKGNTLEYSRNLGFVRSLDFSNNKLRGNIPNEITILSALVSLNLSHNTLSGGIPKNIGFMQELESMDLSANKLSGEIPQSLSSLTSLGKLNLSHNRLSGRIPFGNQIQTFDASSFADNELCGSPLLNKCSNDVVPNDENDQGGEDDEDDGNGKIWFFASMAFGFVGGFWCFVGPLLLIRRWRFAYSQFLDRMWDKIWWKLHVTCRQRARAKKELQMVGLQAKKKEEQMRRNVLNREEGRGRG